MYSVVSLVVVNACTVVFYTVYFVYFVVSTAWNAAVFLLYWPLFPFLFLGGHLLSWAFFLVLLPALTFISAVLALGKLRNPDRPALPFRAVRSGPGNRQFALQFTATLPPDLYERFDLCLLALAEHFGGPL